MRNLIWSKIDWLPNLFLYNVYLIRSVNGAKLPFDESSFIPYCAKTIECLPRKEGRGGNYIKSSRTFLKSYKVKTELLNRDEKLLDNNSAKSTQKKRGAIRRGKL